MFCPRTAVHRQQYTCRIDTTADLHITWRRDCSALQPYIFPVRLQKQMQYLFELLRTLREQLAEIGIHTTPGDDSRRHQIDQLIIKSYLLSTRAEDLQESLPEMQKYSDFEDARKQHMEFLASYLAQYMT